MEDQIILDQMDSLCIELWNISQLPTRTLLGHPVVYLSIVDEPPSPGFSGRENGE